MEKKLEREKKNAERKAELEEKQRQKELKHKIPGKVFVTRSNRRQPASQSGESQSEYVCALCFGR